MIQIMIPGRPVPWARTRGAGNARYLDPAYRSWRSVAVDTFTLLAGRRQRWPLPAPVAVCVVVRAAGVHVALWRPAPGDPGPGLLDGVDFQRGRNVRGDLDNYLKGVLDAAEAAGVIANDRDVALNVAAFGSDAVR